MHAFLIKATLLRHAMVNSWSSTFVFARHCIAKLPSAKRGGDTSDTAFCGNRFPREESIDNRGSQRLQGNRLVSASCHRCPVKSETWRIAGASLRIPPPRPNKNQ